MTLTLRLKFILLIKSMQLLNWRKSVMRNSLIKNKLNLEDTLESDIDKEINNSDLEQLKKLIQEYIDQSKNKKKILLLNKEHVSNFLMQIFRLNELTEKQRDVLFSIVATGNLNLIKPIIRTDIEYATEVIGKYNTTMLHIIATRENDEQPDIVQYLLEKGANLNIKDSTGITAFHSMIHHKQYQSIKIIVNNFQNNALSLLKNFSNFEKEWNAMFGINQKLKARKFMGNYGGLLGKHGGMFQKLQGSSVMLWKGYHHYDKKKKVIELIDSFDISPSWENFKALVDQFSDFVHGRDFINGINLEGEMVQRLTFLIVKLGEQVALPLENSEQLNQSKKI